jgi:hypothetical protein
MTVTSVTVGVCVGGGGGGNKRTHDDLPAVQFCSEDLGLSLLPVGVAAVP